MCIYVDSVPYLSLCVPFNHPGSNEAVLLLSSKSHLSVCELMDQCAFVCSCVCGHPPAVLLCLNDPCSAWELGVSRHRD